MFGLGPITKQLFALAMDETGARVVARVVMMTGVPDFSSPPDDAVFGARGPVLMWFTAPGSDQPFSIIGTTAGAWLEPDSEVDIEGLALPRVEPAAQTVVAYPATVHALYQGLTNGTVAPTNTDDLEFVRSALTQLMYLVGPMLDEEYLSRALPPVAESDLPTLAAHITRVVRDSSPDRLATLITSGELMAILERANQR